MLQAFQAFIITSREGIEAFLIVAVVLTAVRAHFAARRTMKLRGNG